MWLWGRK